MADGKVVIDVILDDGKVVKGVANVDKSLGGLGGTAKNSALSVGKIASALGLVYLAKKGIDLVKNSLDGAIDRYDTLNNFPRVMQQMGFDAEESERAIQKLSDGVQGLPTRLDEVASTAQNIAVMTGDLDGAVDTTIALNNAFLASGASTADAERGLRQYVQMLSKGKVDADSWYTLQETMPYALRETAEAFGYTGESATNDFYDALKSGDITMSEFNDKLIELDTAQGGFAETALAASGGIRTAWTNMSTWVVTGVADIIGAIDKAMGGTGEIENAINRLKPVVQGVFGWIAEVAIPKTADVIKILIDIFGDVIDKAKEVWQALQLWLPLIASIAAGVVTFLLIANAFGIVATIGFKVATMFNYLKTIILAVRGAVMLMNSAILMNPIALIVAAMVAAVLLIYIYWEPIKEFFINLWNSIKEAGLLIWENLKQGWHDAKENLTQAWESVKEFFSNLWQSIVDVFNAAYEWLNDLTGGAFGEYVEIIQSYLMTAWEIITSIWDFIKETFSNVLDFLKALVTGDFEGMKEAMRNQLDNAKNLLVNIWDAIKNNFGAKMTEILSNVIAKFIEIKNNIQNKMSEARGALVAKLVEMVTNTVAKGANIVTAIRNAFTKFVTAVKEKLTEAVRTLVQKVGEMPGKVTEKAGDMLSAGADLVKGMIEGIKNMAGAAIEAITGVVDGVVSKAKSLLKIKSPSRIFMEFGGFVSEGLAIGIEDEAKQAIKSTEQLAKGVEDAFNTNLGFEIDELSELDALKGINANSVIGNIASSSYSVQQEIIHRQANANRYDDSTIVKLLEKLVDKDGNVYINGEKVGSIMDKEQAKRIKLLEGWVAID